MNLPQDAKYAKYGIRCALLVTGMLATHVVFAQTGQRTQSQPVNDSAAQASPVAPVLNTPAIDSAAEASPIAVAHTSGPGVPAQTAVRIVLNEGIDSGSLKNGQTVYGKVSSATMQPPHGSTGRGATALVKPGTPVTLSVIATVPAGKLNAVGELSLELVRIGGQTVSTDVQTFRGKPGSRDLPDSAPTTGTNAGLPAGAELTFTVQPEPGFTEPPPQPNSDGPGSVTGLASGSKPRNFGQPAVPTAANGNTRRVQAGVNPASPANAGNNGTPQPAQHAGQVGTSSNQPAAPTNATPTTTTQPH